MKYLIGILSLVISLNTMAAQNIINSPFLTTGVIKVGEKVSAQFMVNPLTVCDSYTIDVDVDYFLKEIDIIVNYNYNSACDESNSSFFEMIEKQILLEGIYNAKLILNVPFDFSLNEEIFLGTVFVNAPINNSCSDPFIPFPNEFCPTNFNTVCACNGVTYQNECQAYLGERNGFYNSSSCEQLVLENRETYSCNSFNSNFNNYFENYSCSSREYRGNEIYLEYYHDENDTLRINYTASWQDVRVFLVTIQSQSLVCLAESNNGELIVPNLTIGNYFLVVDREQSGSYSINFCKTVATNELEKSNLNVFPNPATSDVYINSNDKQIEKIQLYSLLGERLSDFHVNSTEYHINTDHLNGMYRLTVLYRSGLSETKTLVIAR